MRHHTPRKRNSPKINLIISGVFHTVLISALIFFAAREGLLGKKLKTIAVQMAPKEKPPEKKPEEQKPEEPKVEEAKPQQAKTEQPKVEPPKTIAARPPTPPPAVAQVAPPSVAPPVVGAGSFTFQDDSAKIVQTSSDPAQLYKGMVEYALRTKWNRPSDVPDDLLVAEVDLSIDATGKITGYDWKKGSGETRWDDSVRKTLKQTGGFNRPPPKNFPGRVLVRFDTVKSEEPLDGPQTSQVTRN